MIPDFLLIFFWQIALYLWPLRTQTTTTPDYFKTLSSAEMKLVLLISLIFATEILHRILKLGQFIKI